VIAKDRDGIVISWNRAAEQLYGYSEDEMIGHPVSRIIPANRSTGISMAGRREKLP